jgi:hypothetical protein
MTAVVDEAAVGGFDALPAGPALAAALEAEEPSSFVGEEAAAWMRGACRVRNHADWLLLVSIHEACRSRAGTTARAEFDEFAPKIAAASLGWTATMAAGRVHLAVGVLDRMPRLGEAMRDGGLDASEAQAFVTGLEGLSDEQARRVVDAVLPDVASLGLSALRERILDAAYAIDPIWGAARLAAATARARVTAETAPSGAVDLCGRDLDPNLAQQAKQRLRALALAVRAQLRARGRKIGLGFVEARVFIRLMDGTQAGAGDDTAIIDALITELAADPSGATGDPNPDASGPDDDGPPDDDGGPDRGPDDRGPDDDPDGGSPDGDSPDGGDPDRDADASRTGDLTGTGAGRCVVFTPGFGVRLALSTLLRLDDQPGHLPGLGPVPAETARAAALARGAAAWKVLVHDRDGRLEHLLTLRAPPRATTDPRFGRQTVQLTAPAALLHALDAADPSDIAAATLTGARPTLIDAATTTWLTRALGALVRAETADPDDHPATTIRERARRFPGARLAEFVRARDQTCVAPSCTRPAEACDLDHTLDWLYGGNTEAGGLDTLCRHDHRAKHQAGWHYEQPEPGRFVITDPTGTRHHVDSRVTHARPTPHAPGHAVTPDPTRLNDREDWAPRRTRDGRVTPEARATADELMRNAHDGDPPSRYDHDPDF